MAVKNGIGLVGSVIVDTVYEVMEPGNLVYSDGARYLTGDDYEAEHIEYGTGGMALNNCTNLAKMGARYPVRVIGKIGKDDNGHRIREIIRRNGFSDNFLIETGEHPTSTTHVIYVRDSSGGVNRTFRYFFGAMGSFAPEDIDYTALDDLKIVMIGYCLLMPLFDRPDHDYGAQIGRVLEKLKAAGVTTCIDFVTPKREKWWKFKRFATVLKWVDILSIGEDQAEGLTGITDECLACERLVRDYGVGTAVVHCGDKGVNYLYNSVSGLLTQPIFAVPPEELVGNNGAGDAFTSGLLHGIHQEWDNRQSLAYATAAAAVSLGSLTTTDAMREESYILEYMKTRPLKKR